MPSLRVSAVLLLGSLLLTSSAAAAPARSGCPLLVDPPGDATGTGPVGATAPNDPQLDVLASDLDTRGRRISAVIELGQLSAVDPAAPTGRAYYVNFLAAGAELYLTASVDATGASTYRTGVVEGVRRTLGEATGSLDPTTGTLRISAPVDAFGSYAKRLAPRGELRRVAVLAQRRVATPVTGGFTFTADTATTERTHVLGSAGCPRR